MRLTESYVFPDHILADILAYDSALRVAWDHAERCIRVERKLARTSDVSPRSFAKGSKDRQSAVERYALLYRLNPGQEHLIVPRLHADDLWRRGGGRLVATEHELAEEAQRERWKRRVSDHNKSIARETYRHLNTVYTVSEGAGHKRFLGTGRGERLD